MLYRPMQEYSTEVSILRLGVQSLIGVIVKLDVDHIFIIRLVKDRSHSWDTLLSYIRSAVSCLADLIVLTLLGHIFDTNTANRVDRFILHHPVAFSLNSNVIFFVAIAR